MSFAAADRKTHWSGCIQAATVICQQIFSILALVIFLLKILLKSASKLLFFALVRDPVLKHITNEGGKCCFHDRLLDLSQEECLEMVISFGCVVETRNIFLFAE